MEIMKRRSFLAAAMAALPLALAADPTPPQPLSGPGMAPQSVSGGGLPATADLHLVRSGEGRMGEHHAIGLSTTSYKVLTADSGGDLFVIQHASLKKGGPPKHLHHNEDEFFLVLEGDYLIEVGKERLALRPGDSILGPRGVPHTWAFAGETPGRMLIAFAPAGQMEAFFKEAEQRSKNGEFSPDAKLWASFGLELLGPPIQV